MGESNPTKDIERKTGRVKAASVRYGVGPATIRKIAKDAGAIIRIGNSVLINYSIVDRYMDILSGNGESRELSNAKLKERG